MGGIAIEETDFQNGTFIRHIDKLMEIPRARRNSSNGADQIAGFLLNRLSV